MYQAMYFIHVISAILLMFYVLLPFLAGGAAVRSTAAGLHTANRIGQYVLIAAFLSGGYMVSKAGYSAAWMAVSVALVLVMFAMAGMATKPLKRLKAGESASDALPKLRTFSLIAGVSYLLLILLMLVPTML